MRCVMRLSRSTAVCGVPSRKEPEMPTDAQRRNLASAHHAEVMALLTEQIEAVTKDRDLMEQYWNEAMATHKNIALLEQQLAEARKDAADADSMSKALAAVCDKNDARWKFLHTINKDAQGFEWCVMRVKWENGRISEALHTYSDMSDLDAAITSTQEQP
jgi:hypothetical protein